MFGPLISILLALLFIDGASHAPTHPWPSDVLLSFCFVAFSYLLLIGVIVLEKRWLFTPRRELLVHAELLCFLIGLLYFVGIQRFIWGIPFYKTLISTTCLGLYFIGIAVYRKWKTALFYAPFALPFLCYQFLMELLYPLFGENVHYILIGLFALFFLALFPLLLRRLWNCAPLPHSVFKERLDAFCQAQGFRHGGLQLWKGMQGATAAIIGILPRTRYVLFTKTLLHHFPEEEVEAILAHEIGHSRYKHLLLYPSIFVGLVPIYFFMNHLLFGLPDFFILCCEAALLVIYFRFVFGFFSRQFEKQADLFTVSAGLSAHYLISALHRLAHLHHIPLAKPNWHHGSIAKRIVALQQASRDPTLPHKHRKQLKLLLLAYFSFIAIIFTLLF